MHLRRYVIAIPILFGCAQATKPTSDLLTELKTGDRDAKIAAAATLGERPDAISEALSNTIRTDTDIGVRFWAIASLARRGESGRPAIELAAKDPNPCIRRVAECALIQLNGGNSAAREALCHLELDKLCEHHRNGVRKLGKNG